MLDTLYHIFNYIIALCYFSIFLLIFSGLVREKALGRNTLGTATSGIFLTCGLGHLVHATSAHVWGDLWQSGLQVLVDGWTTLPAITYLILRRRYGLIIRGPDMINEYRTQLAQQSAELKAVRQFEKLKDDFIAMAGHELRTPLTVIKGYAQILSTRLTDVTDPKIVFAATNINQQVDRVTKMVNMLLDVSRIQSGKLELRLENKNLNKLVQTLVENLQLTTTHQLNLHLPEQPLWANVDSDRLEQVVANLVNNAIKYSPEANLVEITLRQVDEQALVTVTDYGRGISQDELPHLFERFYRSPQVTNSTKEGLGLGLYISNEIVRAVGGTITVRSQPGLGSTFTVTLPLTISPSAATSEDLQIQPTN